MTSSRRAKKVRSYAGQIKIRWNGKLYKHQNLRFKNLHLLFQILLIIILRPFLLPAKICLIYSGLRSDTSKAEKPIDNIDIHLVCLIQLTVYRNSDQKLGYEASEVLYFLTLPSVKCCHFHQHPPS